MAATAGHLCRGALAGDPDQPDQNRDHYDSDDGRHYYDSDGNYRTDDAADSDDDDDDDDRDAHMSECGPERDGDDLYGTDDDGDDGDDCKLGR